MVFFRIFKILCSKLNLERGADFFAAHCSIVFQHETTAVTLVLTSTSLTAFVVQVYGDEKFKKAALACGECVWKRGFLQKGYGICHGTAGNAYTFLALHRLTNDVTHLHRYHANHPPPTCTAYLYNQR